GISRKELRILLATRFVKSNTTAPIYIKAEKRDSDSVQFDIERVENVTLEALDRIHRFVRLWRKTNWCMEELDLVLSQISLAEEANGIDSDAIAIIGHF